MQDPLRTLRLCLKSGWTLTGDLAEANIRFSTENVDRNYEEPQVVVAEVDDIPTPFELGYGVIRIYSRYQIDCWITVKRATGKGPGIAKDQLFDMREHVRDILKANLTGLTDLKLVLLNQPGRPLHELDGVPPRLRWAQDVGVEYEI